MLENDLKRLTRLTAILTQLQSKRLVTASALAAKFSVSKRTIYRDIKALEQTGVPIYAEEGKGYKVMDGYRIPPIMFSESEANALITAEKLIVENNDSSFVKEYCEAISKIRSVLKSNTKDKADLLYNRLILESKREEKPTSNFLSILQLAITNFELAQIKYYSPNSKEITNRIIEPFALYTNQEIWLLIAFCRLRKDYRAFRLDRIKKLTMLQQTFEPHKITIEDYFEMSRKKC